MSIRWKLVVISIALVFIVILATGTFIIYALRSDASDNARSDMAARAAYVQLNVINQAINDLGTPVNMDDSYWRDELESLFVEPLEIMTTPEIQIYIIGAVPHPHLIIPFVQEGFMLNTRVIEALEGEASFSAFNHYPDYDGNSVRWFQYAHPVVLDEYTGDVGYVIYLRMSAELFLDDLAATTRIMLFGGMIALGSAILLGIAFSVPLTKNLLDLNREILEFKVGNAPIKLTGAKDEIGQLADGFNIMSQDLSRTLTNMTNEKNKMEIIMYNMTDGVLAYDASGTLIHSNYICEELLGISEIRDIKMAELFKILDVRMPQNEHLDLLEDTVVGRGEKFINASFNTYKDDAGAVQGIVIVFQDITKHMHLDNMRKDFVANVSHELRTPLTTIKGYAETLLDGAGEDPHFRNSFLETINNEADRMTDIIRDLLELSRFDGAGMEFEFEKTDLATLTAATVQIHQITAEKQEKELTFVNEIAGSAECVIDPSRISQVLNNIISNSLRYSHAGAKINVIMQERVRYYVIYIIDDGIGIPREDLRMIFERFYRVDKNRSRELGGTGLGLSIAKEIMTAHDGRIHATSQLGKGTTMSLRFPKPKNLEIGEEMSYDDLLDDDEIHQD